MILGIIVAAKIVIKLYQMMSKSQLSGDIKYVLTAIPLIIMFGITILMGGEVWEIGDIGLSILVITIVYLKYRKEITAEIVNGIPERIKPWMVNYRYTPREGTIDKNAIIATLLDWDRKGFIRYNNGEIRIIEFPKEGLDRFEKKLKWALVKLANGDLIRGESVTIRKLWETMRYYQNSKFWKNFSLEGTLLIGMLAIANILLWILNVINTNEIMGVYLILGFYLSVIVMNDSLVFRGFREREFRRYKKWMGFRVLLEDYNRVKLYGPRDKEEWMEWLAYAVALGTPKNVLRVMKERGYYGLSASLLDSLADRW